MTVEQARKDIQAMRDEAENALADSYNEEQKRLATLYENLTEVLKELEEPEPPSDGWVACTAKDIEQAEAHDPEAVNKVDPNITYPTCPICQSTACFTGHDGIRYCATCSDNGHIKVPVAVPPGFLEEVDDVPDKYNANHKCGNCSNFGSGCVPTLSKHGSVGRGTGNREDDWCGDWKAQREPVAPKPVECDHRNIKTEMCDDGMPCKAAWRGCAHYTPLGSKVKPLIDPALTDKGDVLCCPNCKNALSYPSVEREDEYWCGECDTYVPAHTALIQPKDEAPAPAVLPEILTTVKAYGAIPYQIRSKVVSEMLDTIWKDAHLGDHISFKAALLRPVIKKHYPKLKPKTHDALLSAHLQFLVREEIITRSGVGCATRYSASARSREAAQDMLFGTE